MVAAHKITRPTVDTRAFYGFILKKSARLTLFAEEYDFLLDGYRIIRNSDIAVCKVTPSSRYCSRVMQKESLLGGLESIPDVNLADWQTALAGLRDSQKYVIVEDEITERFLIGPIRRVNRQSVTIRCFDGAGKWQGEERMDYAAITCVSFDKRYITTHQKYLKNS